MKTIKTALFILALVCFTTGLVSCTSLALSGAKKYKVDLINVLNNLDQEIQQDGKVKPASVAALESKLAQYKKDFGDKASYIQASQVLELIKKADAEPGEAFNYLQQASGMVLSVSDTLKLEVPD
jgi:hypothetical protein